MSLEEISEFASDLAGVVEEQPFGPDVDVLKVGGKIFAILSPESSPEVDLTQVRSRPGDRTAASVRRGDPWVPPQQAALEHGASGRDHSGRRDARHGDALLRPSRAPDSQRPCAESHLAAELHRSASPSEFATRVRGTVAHAVKD